MPAAAVSEWLPMWLWNVVRPLAAISMFFVDLVFDVEVALLYYRRDDTYWFIWTIAFVLLSAFFSSIFSAYRYLSKTLLHIKRHGRRDWHHHKAHIFGFWWKTFRVLFHALLIPLVWRYVEMIYYASKIAQAGPTPKDCCDTASCDCRRLSQDCSATANSCKPIESIDKGKKKVCVSERSSSSAANFQCLYDSEFKTTCQIMMLESCLESVPQIILQLYIVMKTVSTAGPQAVNLLIVAKIVFSAISASLSAVHYTDLPLTFHKNDIVRNVVAVSYWCCLKVLVFVWNLFTITPRILAWALFAYQYRLHVLTLGVINVAITAIFVSTVYDLVAMTTSYSRPTPANCLHMFSPYKETENMNAQDEQEGTNMITNNRHIDVIVEEDYLEGTPTHTEIEDDAKRDNGHRDTDMDANEELSSMPEMQQESITELNVQLEPKLRLSSPQIARTLDSDTNTPGGEMANHEKQITITKNSYEGSGERVRHASSESQAKMKRLFDSLNKHTMESRMALTCRKPFIKIAFYIIIYMLTPVLREDPHYSDDAKRNVFVYLAYYFIFVLSNIATVLSWFLNPVREEQVYDKYCLPYSLCVTFVGMAFLSAYLALKKYTMRTANVTGYTEKEENRRQNTMVKMSHYNKNEAV